MKELSIKEKAKAYDEALEKARIWQNNLYDTNDKDYADELNYIFPELKEEPEDERIRKALINVFATHKDYEIFFGVSVKDILAWLEKQSNPTDINPSEFDLRLNKLLKQFETLPKEELVSSLNFYLNIVQNDGTYREEKQGEQKSYSWKPTKEQFEALDYAYNSCSDTERGNYYEGVLETLIEDLHRLEKQGEQKPADKVEPKDYNSIDPHFGKPADKVEPKFLNGQWIVWHGKCYTVYDNSCGYELLDQDGFITSLEYGTVEVNAHRWTIDDAKDGDVLADNIGVILFKSIRDNNVINYYAYLSRLFAIQKGEEYWGYAVNCALSPATKEQRERFFAAMHNAGYEWDAEKKELKKIDQKPEDKAVPKFKKDEWITDGNSVLHITNIDYGFYQFEDSYNAISIIDKKYHLWTIKDAKDGDVLIDKSGSREGLFIFKETKPSDIKTDVLNNPLTVLGYCGIGGAGFTKGSGWGDTANCTYYPATKEQRDLLFQKIHEAGYEWDAEKKELKKIEQKYAE